jgi:hypothetical protein
MKSLDYVVLVAALALIAVASAQAIPKDPAPAALAPAAPPAATSAVPAAPDADAAKADTPEARRAARIDALKKREAEFRLRQSLRTRRVKLAVEQTAVKDVLLMLAQWGGFSIVYDPDLEQAGIDLAARSVTLSFTGLSYDDALTLVLPRECGYRVGPGYVLVTTLEKSWVPLRTATYSVRLALAEIPNFEGPHINISDITQQAASASGGGGAFGNIFNPPAVESDEGKVTPDRIIEIIKKFVRHENDRRIAPWDDEGGPASMSYMNGVLVVSQTDAGHAAVARLIAMIE